MFVLNPNDTTKASTSYSKIVDHIPPGTQQFGFVPNPSDLLISDAILSGPVEFTWGTLKQNTIRWVQSKILNCTKENEHVQWTHVAMSISSFDVIEAVTPTTIRRSMLESYIPDYRLRARRIMDWTDNQRKQFADEFAQRLGERYDRWTAFKLGLSAIPIVKWFVPASPPASDSKEKICSTSYSDTYMNCTLGGSLWPGEKLEARASLPADISRSPVLKDVEWHWLKL